MPDPDNSRFFADQIKTSAEERIATFEENRRKEIREAALPEADKPRQRFVEEAMKAGCPSIEFANFLWERRCTHDSTHGDVFVGGGE